MNISPGIHAEPITFGFKVAGWLAEMLRNRDRLVRLRSQVAIGKISGAVGTYANIDPRVEALTCKLLGLEPDTASTQVVSRDLHAEYIQVFALIAASIERFAVEIRNLQRTDVLEVEEFFSKGQKGSSAMPHKRNPVRSERLSGLARIIRGNAIAALENMALWHERDISHSSAERVILPDSVIALEYILSKMIFVLEDLHVYPDAMERVLNITRGLVCSQRLMLALVDTGLEREEAYALVQTASMTVWGDPNLTLRKVAGEDAGIKAALSEEKLDEIFDLSYFLRNIQFVYKRLGLD